MAQQTSLPLHRILLVDDDPLFARNTVESLRRAGYETHHVVGGAEAITAISSGSYTPDVVVLDIDLRDSMDGIDVAREIAALSAIPVLFLSGHVDRETVARVGDVDHVGYVTKDAGPYVLEQSIRTAIRLADTMGALHESEERFRSVVTEGAEAVAMTDVEGRQIVWNRAAEELTGIPAREALGTPLWEIMERLSPEPADDGRRLAFFELVSGWLSGQRPIPSQGTVTNEIRHIDGALRTVEQRVFPVPGRSGMRLGTVMRDVTRRVEAEAAVRELLSERTRLLHESHEHIQTDMHLVRSLLSVQRYRSADPATQTALAEAEQHIQLLTRLYDQIYRSEEVESVALPRLVHDVLADVPLPDETVAIEEEIERISVSRRICVPIAFVVRELVVNALKHAFGTQLSGTIGVTIRRIDESWLEILVTDDGAGMPVVAGMHTSHGFGLAMVTTFAEQFNGSARIEGDRGVRVRVTMQLPKLDS